MLNEVAKRPYREMRPLAEWVRNRLAPHCEQCEIAGSIRRLRATVKDVEIVCVPKMQTDLFGTGATGVYDPNFVGELQQLGTIRQGDAYRGKYIRIELPKGVMVDIFTAASSNYGLIKMYRTGSREWLQAVMLARLAANGYRSVDGHLYKMVPQNMTTLERDTIQEPALVRYDTPTEKEVFAAMGMAYVQAPDRECKPVIKIKK